MRVIPGKGSRTLDVTALQHRLLAFGDDEISRTSAALDEYAVRLGTPKAAEKALEWKLANVNAMVDVLTGANPQMHLLDTVSMITLTRMALQVMAPQGEEGAALAPWLELSAVLERNIWEIAADFLQPSQQKELRDAVSSLSPEKLRTQEGLFFRPQEFATGLRLGGASSAKGGGSFFSLFNLDPWYGLDPAVREIAESRLFAERAMFALQRLPTSLRWHFELTARQVLALPDVQGLLANLSVVGGSSDKIGRAAELVSRHRDRAPGPDRRGT